MECGLLPDLQSVGCSHHPHPVREVGRFTFCIATSDLSSIIIENFSTRSGNALLTTEQRHWVDLSKYIKAQTPSQLPKLRPESSFRAWCYDRAVNKDGLWSRGLTGIYYIHILLLM